MTDTRVSFFEILKRRKKSVFDWKEEMGFKTEEDVKTWMDENNGIYSYSEEFLNAIKSALMYSTVLISSGGYISTKGAVYAPYVPVISSPIVSFNTLEAEKELVEAMKKLEETKLEEADDSEDEPQKKSKKNSRKQVNTEVSEE